jgi:hypothetical protein
VPQLFCERRCPRWEWSTARHANSRAILSGRSQARKCTRRNRGAANLVNLRANGQGSAKKAAQSVRRCSHLRAKCWSERGDSNSRPLAPEASALPGCATLRPTVRLDDDSICRQADNLRRGRYSEGLRAGQAGPEAVTLVRACPRIRSGGRRNPSLRLLHRPSVVGSGRRDDKRPACSHVLAAVDVQLGAVDIARLLRAEEIDGLGHFLGLAETAERDLLLHDLVGAGREDRRVDLTR